MKTIEERANEFAEKEYYTGSYEKERLSFGYYHGATDQKAIDDEARAKDMRNMNIRKQELIYKAWKLACDAYAQGILGDLMTDIDTFTKYLEE